MNSPAFKRIARLLPFAFYLLLAVFLYLYLRTIDYSKFADIRIDWSYVVIATLFGLGVRYWGAYVWLVLLRSLSGKHIEQKIELVYVYARSWLARYIPGTAAWIISKVYFASRLGISKNKLAVSSLLESGLQVTVVMAVSFALLLADPRFSLIGGNERLLILAALAGCIVAITPPVFNRVMSLVYRVVKRKTFAKEHHIDARIVLRGSFLYIIWSLIGGFSLFFIAKAVYPELGFENLLFVMGVSNLAGALSMLAFFAPSGLGVREGIQLVMLSIIMPTEYALVVTIVMRLWSILVDLLFFAVAFCVVRLAGHTKP